MVGKIKDMNFEIESKKVIFKKCHNRNTGICKFIPASGFFNFALHNSVFKDILCNNMSSRLTVPFENFIDFKCSF